jgi:transcriptional regulator with XRE-family HTH domain
MEKIERKARGERIRSVRLSLGLNQEAFGKLLGLKTSTISGYEAGDAEPKPGTLAAIAAMVEKSLDWLITGKEPGDLPAGQKGEIAATIEPGAPDARDRLVKQRAAALAGGSSTKAAQSPAAPADTTSPHAQSEKIDIHEGLLMTTRVLQSETGYAVALWSNLKSFDEAVKKEEKVKDLERKMDLLLEKMSNMEERLAEKSGGVEKRDKSASA